MLQHDDTTFRQYGKADSGIAYWWTYMPLRFSLTTVLLVAFGSVMQHGRCDELPKLGEKLSDAQVAAFAKLALDGIEREYPNKPSNVVTGPESVKSPRQLHPAFYGCFDWHSSVHGHWMLVRLLKLYPDNSLASEIRDQLNRSLTAEKLRAETAYFDEPSNRSFERMYGWAWALRLAAELHTWDDDDGKKWRANIRPLEVKIVELAKGYLPRLSHPIRTGVHPDTAFALGQALDYARVVGDKELEQLIVRRGREFYLDNRDYPAAYEPSGEDFFSAGLNEADFMRRILSKPEFSKWLDQFLPGLAEKKVGNLLTPVEVTDVTDGKLVHLAGLDLSRGWTLRGIGSAFDNDDRRKPVLDAAAASHARTGYKYVFSGHYEGEHWLATFAVYLHTRVGIH
jgi:hypothetical protein